MTDHPEDTPTHAGDNVDASDASERTVAYWHPGMTQATYRQLLRVLFDPQPEAKEDESHRAA